MSLHRLLPLLFLAAALSAAHPGGTPASAAPAAAAPARAAPAPAAPTRASPTPADRIDLTPAGSVVGIRFYGLGLLPIDGNYTRFHGWLTYDPATPAHCQVELTIDAASLTMGNASIRDEVVGPEFMDATRFPTLEFSGSCQQQGLEGDLTMHGVTHAFALSLDRSPDKLTATGRLRRADWGMTARPLLGGSTVRIQVTAPLPHSPDAGAPGR